MTGHIRIHVDLPLDAYRVLARATHGEVGRLLRTLATRAALSGTETSEQERSERPQAPTIERGEIQRINSGDRRYQRTTRRMAFIRQQLTLGAKVGDIAGELGITESAVYQYMRRIKHTPPTREERILGIPSLARAGYTPTQIAQTLNLNIEHVAAYIEGLRDAS